MKKQIEMEIPTEVRDEMERQIEISIENRKDMKMIEKFIIASVKSELRFIEYSKKFWVSDYERELGNRILTLGYTVIDNIDAGYGPINYEDYEMSVKQYNENVTDYRKTAE